MKYLKIFEQFLNEGISDVVYHFTSFPGLVGIAEDDAFFGTLSVGTNADQKFQKGRTYFFSTTRSKREGYQSGVIKFVLDGRKLGQRYKAEPMDYWEIKKDGKAYEPGNRNLRSHEMEDRILLNEPKIAKAAQYIKEIHIDKDPKRWNMNSQDTDILLNWIKKNRIPTYLYFSDRNDLDARRNFLNQREGVKLEDVEDQIKRNDEEWNQPIKIEGFDTRVIARVIVALAADNPKEIDRLVDLSDAKKYYDGKIETKLRGEIEMYTSDMKQDVALFSRAFRNDLHDKRSRRVDVYREFFKMLSNDMRKYKTGDIQEYLTKKYNL